MIEVPEYILWDGDSTDSKPWRSLFHEHFWFSPKRGELRNEHFYSLLDDGRIVRITHLYTSKRDDFMPVDAVYLGMGYTHHIKELAR